MQISPESMRKDVETIYEQQQNIGYESEFIVGEKECTNYMKKMFSDWQAKDITNILHEKRGGYSKNKVAIINVPNTYSNSVAELVITYILSLARNIISFHNKTIKGIYDEAIIEMLSNKVAKNIIYEFYFYLLVAFFHKLI